MIKELKATGLAVGLSGMLATGAFAAPAQQHPGGNTGGAAGLVAAVVQVVGDDLNITDNVVQVGLVNLNNSLNNLTALNNVLNNSPILSNNDIDIIDVIDIGDINVLNDVQITALNNFLNDSNILLNDVIAIAVLSGGDLIVLA